MKIKKRFWKVAILFFKILLDFRKEIKISKRKGFAYAQKVMYKTHQKRAKEFYNIAIELGGVMIKLCQFISTRRDMFPEPYIEILSNLQDSVPPIDFDKMKEILVKEYKDFSKNFSFIDKTPLASASIGQVHKAVLKNGNKVVLKIKKPDVDKIFDIDFAILYQVFKIFSYLDVFKNNKDFINLLNEFIRVTGDELNFRREIEISKKFKKSLSKFNYVKVPFVYEEFSTNNIIVMEYVEGDKITDIDKWKNRNNDPKIIAKRIINLYIEQFLYSRIIHFDPHPGNILISDNNNIILLDYGMSGEITEKMSRGIINLIRGFVNRDYKLIINILIDLGFLKKNIDKANMISILEYFTEEVADTIKLEREFMGQVDLSPIVDQIAEVIYEQPIRLPLEWAYIGRTIGTISGIISSLWPDFKIFQELNPYFQKILEDNSFEILNTMLGSFRRTLLTTYSLPEKINIFIDEAERGKIKFNFDPNQIDSRIESFKTFIVKSFSFFIFFFTGIYSYTLFDKDNTIGTLIFAGISIISFINFLFYKKKSKKELLKERISNQR